MKRRNRVAMVMALVAEYFILKSLLEVVDNERKLKHERLENEKILENIRRQSEENTRKLNELVEEIDEKILKLTK